MYLDDTIGAVATAPGEAGIGIVRVSGQKALLVADRLFQSKKGMGLSAYPSRRLTHGYIYEPASGKRVDEVLAVWMKAPATYTGEEVVEIHCHGGLLSTRKIMGLILEEGIRHAEPGEFTKRAFLNGRIDLAQAEAVIDLIRAKTEKGFDVALEQMEGHLSRKIKQVREAIFALLAEIEVSIDFSEEDVDEITLDRLLAASRQELKALEVLLDTAAAGKIVREGLRVVIVGKPNVGKSSLLNALLRESRAIVTDIPGTTRDLIEEELNVRGIPLRIIDTAGIRETEDLIEKIGVERSKALFNQADVILMVIDSSRPLSQEDLELLELVKERRALLLLNKVDLPPVVTAEALNRQVPGKPVLTLSLQQEQGLQAVEDALEALVYQGKADYDGSPVITRVRHEEALKRAIKSLQEGILAIEQKLPMDFIEVDFKNTWEFLGEITGETLQEELIDHIFKNFCIGK